MFVYLVYDSQIPYEFSLVKIFSSKVDAENYVSEKLKVEIPEHEEFLKEMLLEEPDFSDYPPSYYIQEEEVE